MRPLEIILILAAILCLFIYRKKPKAKSLCLIPLLLIFVAHLFIEGWRWQLIPVYLVCIYFCLTVKISPPVGRVVLSIGLIFALISTLLTVFIPVPKHPLLAGTYQVGIELFETKAEDSNRHIPYKVWFPIKQDISNSNPAPWVEDLDVMGPAIAGRGGLPRFVFNHLQYFKASQYAKLSNAVDTDKPLVLLAHGRGGFKALNGFMATELASHGHIVIAPDFPGGSLLTVLKNGSQIPFKPELFADDKEYPEEKKYAIIQILGKSWANDIETVVANLKGQFPQLMNKKMFSGGHSTGAAAAINYCQKTNDCVGSIALDAWMKPVTKTILEGGSAKPILALFGDQASDDFEPINQERFSQLQAATINNGVFIRNIEIKEARHIDFCDAALLSPYSYLLGQQKGKIDARMVMERINRESLIFIDETL